MEPRRIEPGPGQESVWDYPRPPAMERTASHLVVEFAGLVIADTRKAWRVLETSQPPAYYIPADDVATERLAPSLRRSFCEWKGQARYYSVRVGERVATDAAWAYDSPFERYAAVAGHLAFYPQAMDACWVDEERVGANEGSFYGGWITSTVVGPFKGGDGTAWW
ncbi:DUF427 domain-containing protein [soil metagenome]